MKKLGALIIYIFTCFIIVGQIIIPINKRRVESYGIWQYDNLIIDTLQTRLNARFIATDTASIWGDYSEKLVIDSCEFECLHESLPLVPFDTTFYIGDTLHYSETFLPIFDKQNSCKELCFIGGDSIDFKIKLPLFEWSQDSIKLQRYLFKNAIEKYNVSDYVASSRSLRFASEMGSSRIASKIIDLADSIYSNIRPLNLNAKKLVVNDLFNIANMNCDSCIIRNNGYRDILLSALNQCDIIDNMIDFSYTDSLCYKSDKCGEAVEVLNYFLKENIFDKAEEIRIYEKQRNYLLHSGHYVNALSKNDTICEIISRGRGLVHPTLAVAKLIHGDILLDIDSIKDAIINYKEALNIFKNTKVFPIGRSDNLTDEEVCHVRLSNAYSQLMNDTLALFHNNMADSIHQICKDVSEVSYANILKQKACIYRDLAEYDNMYKYFNECIEFLCSEESDVDEGGAANILTDITNYVLYFEKYNLAKEYANIELLFAEKTNELCHLYNALNNILNISIANSHTSEAAEFFQRIKKMFGEERFKSSNYFNSLINYLKYLSEVKDFITIEQLLPELENYVIEEYSDDYSFRNSLLAQVYFHQGDIAKALRTQKDEINRRLRLYGEHSTMYATALNNISVYYEYLGDLEMAIEYGEQAYSIRKELLDVTDSNLHDSMSNLIGLYCHTGDFEKSIALSEEYLKIASNPANGITKKIGEIMQNIGYTYVCMDSTDVAYDYISKGAEIIENEYTNNSLEFARALSTLSDYYYSIKDFEKSFHYESSSLNTFKNLVGDANPYYLSKLSKIVDFAYLCDKDSTFHSMLELYNTYLIDNSLSNLQNMEYKDQENYWSLQKTWFLDRLPFFSSKIPNDTRLACHTYNGLLFGKSLLLSIRTNENTKYRWTDVKSSLSEDEVAIEFGKYQYGDTINYIGAVITIDMTNPIIVPLFTDKDLQLISIDDQLYSTTLSKMIWEPLDGIISYYKKVYFSPVGILHTIPIESLPDYKSDGLISDRLQFYRLTSTRELVSNKKNTERLSATIFGNIDYSVNLDMLDSNPLLDLGLTRGNMSPLPGTKREIETISSNLMSSYYDVSIYSNNEATENSFKELSTSNPKLIHVATHGFYWSDTNKIDKIQQRIINKYTKKSTSKEEIALCKSGLIFAGANNSLSGKINYIYMQDDGILTAKEVTNMNLNNVDLVALSACQTGLGEVNDEGVYGLQRGFKIAGVNSILMSLWEVDDDATCLLMSEFYNNYVKGKSKQESLNEAQRVVRETLGYENPEYWAAFILLDGLN